MRVLQAVAFITLFATAFAFDDVEEFEIDIDSVNDEVWPDEEDETELKNSFFELVSRIVSKLNVIYFVILRSNVHSLPFYPPFFFIRVVLCYTPGRPSVRLSVCPLVRSCVRNSSYSSHRNFLKLATMNFHDV